MKIKHFGDFYNSNTLKCYLLNDITSTNFNSIYFNEYIIWNEAKLVLNIIKI